MKSKIILSLIGTYSSVLVPPPTTGNAFPYVTSTADAITIHMGYKITFQTSTSHASYDYKSHILKVWGDRFRVWAVEKNYVAEIDVSSLSYHSNQIIGLYTQYTNPDGISRLEISTTNSYTESYSVSYSQQMTIGLASTITFGFKAYGIEESTNSQLVEKNTFEKEETYSSNFSHSVTKNIEIDLDKDLSDSYVSFGVVANVLEGKITTYLEEHWFYGSYKAELKEDKKFKFLTNINDSLVYKNKSTGKETSYHD